MFALVLVGLYLAMPPLVSALAPTLAQHFGLSTLSLTIGSPRLRGIKIFNLEVVGDGFTIRGENAELGYTWQALLKGQLNSLAFETLAVSVSAQESDSTNPTTGTPSIPASPLRQLSAERLLLELPDIGFLGSGGAVLSEGVLSLALRGEQPEQASRFTVTAAFSYDGVVNASFGERGSNAKEFLTIRGELSASALNVLGEINLTGYALAVASALAGLPQGEGSVVGNFEAQLPWPLPDTINGDDLRITFPAIAIDWTNSDLHLKNLQGAMAFDGSQWSSELTGQVLANTDVAKVQLTLPRHYPMTYQTRNDTVTGGAGLNLKTFDTTTSISATVQSFSLSNLSAPRLAIETQLTARYDDLSAVGELNGNADFAAGTTAPTGNFDFVGEVTADNQTRPVGIQADYQITAAQLASSGNLTSGIVNTAPFELNYHFDSTAGLFKAGGEVDFQQPLAVSLLPEWIEPYDLDSGRADWSLQLDWATPATIAGKFIANLIEASGHYDEYTANGISGELEFVTTNVSDPAGWQLVTTALNAKQIDVGINIENLTAQLGWSGSQVPITTITADLLGGRASTAAFLYDLDAGSASFELRLDDISIAEVLALEGDDVSATGTLNGVLPVEISGNEVSVTNGELTAGSTGGVIRISSALASLSGQPGLDFALAALQDFNYSELITGINYSPNGDLALAVGLKGHNIAVEDGRPIHYNLNISENIPVLLESLRVQDQVTEKVEKQVLR